MARPYRVHVVALENCGATVPIGAADLLRRCAEFPVPGFRQREIVVVLVSAGRTKTIRAAGDVGIQCHATLETAGRCDLAVISALDYDVFGNLARNPRIIPWLKSAYRHGTDLASACTGAFALAEAGLLDGRMATTHWASQKMLAERYPKIRVAHDAVIVDQGRIVTSGGATSYINLTLLLVEKLFGVDVMRAASRMFLIDPNKSPQSAYAAFSTQKGHGDGEILRAQDLIERDVRRAPPVPAIAKHVALSERTFARRFHAATGNTARDYIARVRVEAAKRALERGKAIAGVATAVGYGDPVAFRKLFTKVTGLTPAEYRTRYAQPR